MLHRVLLIIALWVGNAAHAEGVLTDAFGLYLPATDAARGAWAGQVEALAADGVQTRGVAPGPGQVALFYLGEKSLTAGGASGHAVALVLDDAGNLVADGQQVVLTTGADAVHVPTRHGIAARLFAPGSRAGQFHAGAAIAGYQSGRVDYQVLPDLQSLRPAWASAPRDPVLAEDFQAVESAPLADRFGNKVLDGIGGMVQLDHPGGQVTLAPMVTSGGRGQARLLLRDLPDRAEMRFAIGAKVAPRQVLTVVQPRALGGLPMVAQRDAAIAATRLQIGPFLTDAGYALHDGAVVDLVVTTAKGDELRQSGWVMQGQLEALLLVDADAFPLTVQVRTVLGVVRQVLDAPQAEGAP